jgi:hypothetical protein
MAYLLLLFQKVDALITEHIIIMFTFIKYYLQCEKTVVSALKTINIVKYLGFA